MLPQNIYKVKDQHVDFENKIQLALKWNKKDKIKI